MNDLMFLNGGQNIRKINDIDTPPTQPGLGIDLNQPSNRYVGTNYSGSYIILNTDPCMHLPEWKVKYSTVFETGLYKRAYSEGLSSNTALILTIGTANSNSVVSIQMRDTGNVTRIDHNFTQVINDLKPHNITVYRIANDIYCDVDGVVESASMTADADNFGTPDRSTIGALGRSSYDSYYDGEMWNLQKCDQALIPINEGTGTIIKDSSGASVGTLVDPSATYWDKYYGSNVYLAKYVFYNEGLDWINLGRPDWVDAIAPDSPHTIVVRQQSCVQSGAVCLFGLADSNSQSATQSAILWVNDGDDLICNSGGVGTSATGVTVDDRYHDFALGNDGTNVKSYFDGSELASAVAGSLESTNDIYLHGWGSGGAFNPECGLLSLEIYSGFNDGSTAGLALLDKYDFSDPSQWDGGTTGESMNGNAFTVTDGAPSPARRFVWVNL